MVRTVQDVIDNVTGKNKVGIIERVISVWLLFGIVLFIPFAIMMFVIVLPVCLILEPKQSAKSLLDYIKSKLPSPSSYTATQNSVPPTTPTPPIMPEDYSEFFQHSYQDIDSGHH